MSYKHQKPIIIVLFVSLLCGCRNENVDLEETLVASGPNRKELEAVLFHYSQNPKDSLKLKAAVFLISNMKYKYDLDGKQLKDWDLLFKMINNEPENWKNNLPWYSKEIEPFFQKMEKQSGRLNIYSLNLLRDVDRISSEYLINNIDLAFEAYQKPWNKKLSFDEFCEYILPYRAYNEKLEDWRARYVSKFKWVLDSIRHPNDMYEAASFLCKKTTLTYNDAFTKYPVPISPQNLLISHFGLCRDLTDYTTLGMRALGIPVAIDFVPFWGNNNGGHAWNAILDTTGKMVPLKKEMDKGNAQKAYSNKIAKVYRRTFAIQHQYIDLINETKAEIPPFFRDVYHKDVTAEYVQVSDVHLKLSPRQGKSKYAYICVFKDKDWDAIDYAAINKEEKVLFKNMGRDIVYIVMYYINGRYIPASHPFILHTNGKIEFLKANQNIRQHVKLDRKYSEGEWKESWRKSLVNARFEGSNRADFKHAHIFAIISGMPKDHEDTIKVLSGKKYRYFRLVFPSRSPKIANNESACIAEIEFYDDKNQRFHGKPIGTNGSPYNVYLPSNVFDGNILTFYQDDTDNKEKYVGLDLGQGKEKRLSRIVYCPRNDKNGVRPGNLYELFVWMNGQFHSLGQKEAKDYTITYDQVPLGGLYLLQNLTEGNEERIFTYTRGTQVWW